MLTILTPRRRATSDAPHGRSRGVRRAALGLTGVATALGFMLAPSLATADTSSTLTVIGTSDVSDSGLIPNLIGPQFQQAYPQFTFKYIGTASGSAISSAETGSQGASALIVHAPTLENQFVAGGYSYPQGQFGNAIWTNDFVLAGPTGDPAGVAANGANNIAQAFVDVATAGVSGKATFVSRGGTPGTTTEEHAIWADVNNAGLTPSGVTLCAVPANLGGGLTPIAQNGVASNGAACPGGVLPGSAGGGALPTWYVTTGLTQGPNVIAANACTADSKTGPNSCYVLTDRGTYDYLCVRHRPRGVGPEPEDRHPRPAVEHGPGWPVRTDQLFPRLRAEPGEGAQRQPHRRSGLRQLPDLADGAERTQELPPDVGHGRSGRTAIRGHRQSDDRDHRAGDSDHLQGRQAGHDQGQCRQ